jgi:hypothetical protein
MVDSESLSVKFQFAQFSVKMDARTISSFSSNPKQVSVVVAEHHVDFPLETVC